MSLFVRIVCGILGFGGVAATAINAHAEGSVEFDFMLFSGLLGGFLFLYAAFFCSLPGITPTARSSDRGKMSKTKWQVFWVATIVALGMITSFLSEKGVFKEADIVIFSIVGILFALVGVALYFYVKDRPEDFG